MIHVQILLVYLHRKGCEQQKKTFQAFQHTEERELTIHFQDIVQKNQNTKSNLST
jgi:predicted protein tyrosine phosphatase